MTREKIEQKALEYFQSGFICSEAISKAIVEEFAGVQPFNIPKVTTGLGGGVGGTKSEVCGALTGGVVALGYFFGREIPGSDKQRIFHLVTEFRNRFLDAFGSTTCGQILEGFGTQENMAKCKKLTATAAGILYDIMHEELPIK
jgi:C_GCAxxG_C_C family probable redox protein